MIEFTYKKRMYRIFLRSRYKYNFQWRKYMHWGMTEVVLFEWVQCGRFELRRYP